MATSIILRKAVPADQALLEKWDREPAVLASDPDDDWNWETELRYNPGWREQWMAEVDGQPVGFVQIIDPLEEETHYWGETEANLRAIDIWIGEEENRGKGFGTRIMQLAIARCFDHPLVQAILIDPLVTNTRAIRFYEKLGFRKINVQRFGNSDCLVMRLDRNESLFQQV